MMSPREHRTEAPRLSIPACSIVITSTGDVERLRRLLVGVIAHTPAHLYEVVVVFRSGTAETRSFAALLEGEGQLWWCDTDPGDDAARDLGTSLARGLTLAFLDESTELDEGWSDGLAVALLAKGDASVVASGEPVADVGFTAARVRLGGGLVGGDTTLARAACLVRRAALEEGGGFTAGLPALLEGIEARGWRVTLNSPTTVGNDRLAVDSQIDAAPSAVATRRARVHPLADMRNRHEGQDIWVIASGASMSWVEPSFFANKVTIGLNRTYRKYAVDYLVRKEHVGAQDVIDTGIPLFISRRNCGNQDETLDGNGDWWEFRHNVNAVEAMPDLEVIGTPDQLVVSWSTITTGMHLAAYMGAANIIVCGHDCGSLDGDLNYTGYYEGTLYERDESSQQWYLQWLANIETQTAAVRDRIREVYGCSVHSLNPFVSLNLEGHDFRGGAARVRDPLAADIDDAAVRKA